MTRRNTTKRVSVQLRESLYQRLREHAQEQGEQTETLLDGLLAKWLDEEERRN
jgi:hypothetical protein